jgi:hypothetical protein
MKSIAILATACSFALVAQTPQPKTGQIAGHVTDVKGAAISNASVYVRGNTPPSEKVELLTHTDRYGNFTLTLPAGAYDILITEPPFESKVQTILVRPDKSRAVQWKLALAAEMCDFPGAICDDFPEFRTH